MRSNFLPSKCHFDPPPLQYGRPRKGVNKNNNHQSKAGSTGFPTLVQKGNTTLAWIRSIGFRPRDHPFCLFFTFRLWMSFERGGNFPRKKTNHQKNNPVKPENRPLTYAGVPFFSFWKIREANPSNYDRRGEQELSPRNKGHCALSSLLF